MTQVNVLEAKNDLSKLIRLLETGQEEAIVIARNGNPVVQMVLYPGHKKKSVIGAARGELSWPEDIHAYDDEILNIFEDIS